MTPRERARFERRAATLGQLRQRARLSRSQPIAAKLNPRNEFAFIRDGILLPDRWFGAWDTPAPRRLTRRPTVANRVHSAAVLAGQRDRASQTVKSWTSPRHLAVTLRQLTHALGEHRPATRTADHVRTNVSCEGDSFQWLQLSHNPTNGRRR
jgi:hypothetical protein